MIICYRWGWIWIKMMSTFWLQECHLWCPFWFSKFIVSDTVISVDCCAAQWAAGECRRLDRHFRSFNVLEICWWGCRSGSLSRTGTLDLHDKLFFHTTSLQVRSETDTPCNWETMKEKPKKCQTIQPVKSEARKYLNCLLICSCCGSMSRTYIYIHRFWC